MKKKDIEIHEALDLAKKLLKTTRVRVSIGKPLFATDTKGFPALNSEVGDAILRCRIYVLTLHSAVHAGVNIDHAIWRPVAASDTWESAIRNIEALMQVVESIVACQTADCRDGASV